MEPPPRFPFPHPADALDAHLNGTFWPRIRRWAEHLEQWLNTQRPPLRPPDRDDEAAA
jgi:hypothetical protein